jgi:uncharacterized protein YecT (DUF1311 family)
MMMKRITSLLLLLFCYFNPVMAETQYELNKAACDQLQQADNSLNKVYKQILSNYKDDTVFINQFVTAQKKWIEFRDAYVASVYIPQNRDSYGSVFPMCQCYFLEHITSDRIKQLRVWLDGVTEGDVCIGSVKT